MTDYLSLLVKHRIEDLTATSAAETIRRRIEGGAALTTLERAELWDFRFAESAAAAERIRHLVEVDHLFVNPNKHTYRFTDNLDRGWRDDGFLVFVRNRDDLEGTVALETLRNRHGVDGLEEVRFGVLWLVRFSGVTGKAAEALAEKIAVTDDPKGGLLVNPHYQDWEIRSVCKEEGSRA